MPQNLSVKFIQRKFRAVVIDEHLNLLLGIFLFLSFPRVNKIKTTENRMKTANTCWSFRNVKAKIFQDQSCLHQITFSHPAVYTTVFRLSILCLTFKIPAVIKYRNPTSG
jgi:hypothetical protein